MNDEHDPVASAAGHLARGAALACAWVREVSGNSKSVAGEEGSLLEEALRAGNLARKMAASATRKGSLGVFGPSQAGKSYLVSVLARRGNEPVRANFAGTLRNFIEEINPAGGKESTGLVTRFTVDPPAQDREHPVELKLLTETDLVKIIGNAFLSDFDASQRKVLPASEETVRSVVDAIVGRASAASRPHLDEVAMHDISEYFHEHFPRDVQALDNADYWSVLQACGHRLGTADRIALYELLWGQVPDLTRAFSLLLDGLERLQHPAQARASMKALADREISIIDVATAYALGSPADQADLIPVAGVFEGGRVGSAVELSRAVLTILVAELRISLEKQPWPFMERFDLLDFPGARPREKLQEFPTDDGERWSLIVEKMLRRGKVAYLFQRYTDESDLSSMLLCMPPSNSNVPDLPLLVRSWVDRAQGRTPEDRTGKPCALFLVLTKFDQTIDDAPGVSGQGRRQALATRLYASFGEPFQHERWRMDWDGRPFANTVFLRNPTFEQPKIMAYEPGTGSGGVAGVEIGIRPEFAPRLAEFREGFLAAESCAQHVTDPEAVWDAALTLNDGGIAYLVQRLQPALAGNLKQAQLAYRLGDCARRLEDRLGRFHRREDDASRKEKDESLVALRRLLNGATREQRLGSHAYAAFVRLLGRLMVTEEALRGAFLKVAALRGDFTAHLPQPAEQGAAPSDSDDPWGDPASEPGQAGAATAPAIRDRSAAFAVEAMNVWTERVRGLAFDDEAIQALGLKLDASQTASRLLDDLGNELIVGAGRNDLQDRIAHEVRTRIVSAQVRFEDVADRAAGIAAIRINDYVAFLGFDSSSLADRPGFPEPPRPRQSSVFQGHASFDALVPTLGASRLGLESEFFRDWGVALRQAGLDNVNFSGGREITDAQNRRLGEILALIVAARSDAKIEQ